MKKIAVEIYRLVPMSPQQVGMILRECDGNRAFAIKVARLEAERIGALMQQEETQPPLTYTLMRDVLDAFNIRVKCVTVTEYDEDDYSANIELLQGEKCVQRKSRVSDAVGLALAAKCPIYVESGILDTEGAVLEDDEEIEYTEKIDLATLHKDDLSQA